MENFIDLFTNYNGINEYGLFRPPVIGLVVIGNGFDIQCGLKTKYRQFFDYCMNSSELDADNETFYSKASKILDDKDTENKTDYLSLYELLMKYPSYSVWDFYFILEKQSHRYETWNWMDVEQAMQQSLVVEQFWDDAYPIFEEFYESHIKHDELISTKFDDIAHTIAAVLYERYIINEESGLVTSPGETTLKIFYDALLRDLIVFENRFGQYIMKQYNDRKDDYTNVAQENIATIYKNGLKKLQINEDAALLRVISFNYTPILDEDLNDNFVLNIHGLYNAPIFGISEFANHKDDPHVNCYNMFAKKNRKNSYLLDNIRDIVPQKHEDIHIFTYGLSFWNIDAQDFEDIICDYDKNKFCNIVYMYPNLNEKKKEYEITKDILSNLRQLISRMSSKSSKQEIEQILTNSVDSVRLLMKRMS